MMTDPQLINACIQQAIEQLWSGRIELSVKEERVGQVVFVDGRIAWAMAKGQAENLGIFLWRLGRITSQQLKTVQQRFAKEKGKKRLGALLEESGFMTRRMLRRAMLLHTRSALERLFHLADVEGVLCSGNFAADESILFGPEEVLPGDWQQEFVEWFRSDTNQIRLWNHRMHENAVLEPFADLPGYCAAAIVAAEGDVLTAHSSTLEVDMQLLAISIAATVETAARAVKMTLLGRVDVLTLESPQGSLTARWIDNAQRFLALVLTQEGVNCSLTRYTLKNQLPALRRWLPQNLEALGFGAQELSLDEDGEGEDTEELQEEDRDLQADEGLHGDHDGDLQADEDLHEDLDSPPEPPEPPDPPEPSPHDEPPPHDEDPHRHRDWHQLGEWQSDRYGESFTHTFTTKEVTHHADPFATRRRKSTSDVFSSVHSKKKDSD
ncbi:MAG: hypothetical protein JRH20_05795 [Deltaproteobacteria bacterium]|nr:hypothetical protein [Deltaproteobacteria bacterium]